MSKVEKIQKRINKITRFMIDSYYLSAEKDYTINELIKNYGINEKNSSIKKYLKNMLKFMLDNNFIELSECKIFYFKKCINDNTKFKITYNGIKYLESQKRTQKIYFSTAGSFLISITALLVSSGNNLINNNPICNLMILVVGIVVIIISIRINVLSPTLFTK